MVVKSFLFIAYNVSKFSFYRFRYKLLLRELHVQPSPENMFHHQGCRRGKGNEKMQGLSCNMKISNANIKQNLFRVTIYLDE